MLTGVFETLFSQGPHRDGHFERSIDERSLITLNGYLNELPEGCGGCTRFLVDELPLYEDAEGRFKTITAAHDVLSDARQRAEYDGMRGAFGPLYAGDPGFAHAPTPARSAAMSSRLHMLGMGPAMAVLVLSLIHI